jgi:hypothetical protein
MVSDPKAFLAKSGWHPGIDLVEGGDDGFGLDVAKSAALVGRMLIVGLHDTISDPVAQIAGFLECPIEEPVRKISLILVGNEGRLYLLLPERPAHPIYRY